MNQQPSPEFKSMIETDPLRNRNNHPVVAGRLQ